MKQELCKAFCDALSVRDVPAGLAISTPFDGLGDDPLSFYVVGPDDQGQYRIQDGGDVLWQLEAAGADLEIATRAEAFYALLNEYGFSFDEDECVLHSLDLSDDQIPRAAMRFVALLLRVQDLLLLVQEKAASTFREEISRRLAEVIGQSVPVYEKEPVDDTLSDIPADLLYRPEGRPPVALFFSTSDQPIYQALLLDSMARYEAHVPCSVVAIAEKNTSLSAKARQLAANRLGALAVYRGDEVAAVNKIASIITGQGPQLH